MACEQWCYLARGCIFGFILCFVLGSSIAEPDDFYNYKRFENDESNGIEHVFHIEEFNERFLEISREKRHVETPPSIDTTVSPVSQSPMQEITPITTETDPTGNITYPKDTAVNLTDEPSVNSTVPPMIKQKPENTGENTTVVSMPPTFIEGFNDIPNRTLIQYNITRAEEDTHQYYDSTFIVDENIGKSFWVDLENHPDKKVIDSLSASHRRSATVQLKFNFPFYGHNVQNMTIATGGFLYTGEYVQPWLAAAQYIAPLMANFDTQFSKDSYVKYADNGTAFTIEWENVVLQDKPEAGLFTFQATLHENGDIVFVYAQLPLLVEEIEDQAHPIKVGLSDAFIIDRTVFSVRRRIIYEHQRVNFNHQNIKNWTAIYFRALPLIMEESGPTANVTYSTDNPTNSTDEPSINSTVSPMVNQKPENTGENTTVVSTLPTSITRLDDVTNRTLTWNAIIRTHEDTHQYYNSTFFVDENIGKSFWVNLENHPNKKVINLLSAGDHGRATVKLKFDFPFYEHKIRNITIATGGFLYAREKVQSWLPGTQVISPWMINFNTRLLKASSVKYADNSTAFTVEWENVVLQNEPEFGPFTFQATLHENGDIIFVYAKVPILLEEIEDKTVEKVRIGLSETYAVEKIIFFELRKTVHEYRRVIFNYQDIRNWTVIYFRALPTCLQMENCTDCLTKVPELACKWCPQLNQCGSSTSGNRQDWLQKNCDQWSIREQASCPAESKTLTDHTDKHEHSRVISEEKLSARVKRNPLPRQPSLLEQSDFYNYKRLENEESNGIEYVFHTEDLNGRLLEVSRQKRYVEPSPSISTTVSPVSQNPIHDIPVIKTETGSTANVTYSTDNATNSTDEPSTNSTVSPTIKPESGKNATVVTTTPTSTKVPIIWANQTLWPNATKEKTLSKDDNRTTKVNLTRTTDIPTNSSDFDDISITKFNDVTNNTLTQNNITKTEEDTHQYYNSTFIVDENIGRSFWVDLENHPDKKVNDLLSASHRRAATVKLKFDFPFYGHKVRNITIATGGFLYTGEFVHSWLAATQYIAPLMANFDTRLSKDSYVKYADNGTAFTVEWEKVVLQDKQGAGPFTFQATLHENGNIVFVYAQMPLLVEDIEDKAHPVKVGLSDAYIMDRTVFFVRRKTIYEYHRVNFNRQDIRNWTVIYLRALPTCLQMDNCTDCLTKVPEFACKWCPELNQCSTGTFRNRQDWLQKHCEQRSIKEEASCPAGPKTFTDHTDEHEHSRVISEGELSASVEPNRLSKEPSVLEQTHGNMNMSHMGVSGIIGILLVVSLIAGLSGWAAYAYRNPHSASGQMLIRYRPSQWTWRRGEARYTAATIHM